ncbi:DEAD/DEAH box helicase [Aquisphaera insulae]|uniref:DEAD/DEAH box helicase n=1 Tax=Aquisphaera insulae TaxID=2712864 RepID=UPI00196BA8D7|nr:DEAD/DEAH box helicase [Aquisphaera insulae]
MVRDREEITFGEGFEGMSSKKRNAEVAPPPAEPPASIPPEGLFADRWTTAGGIPVAFHAESFRDGGRTSNPRDLLLHLELARLGLLRGFDELLCLEGLTGVEHLPHQIETVRKVLRQFHGRVLLADEVGLGKTIEACLLLREYLLRGMVHRVLILVPAPLVSQWHEELGAKFHLDFSIPPRTAAADREEFWMENDCVLTSLAFAKARKRSAVVAAQPWDLVIVDEAHHCKNRSTQNWQLINALQRRYMFLLSATPVQNNLIELYNLLTLLLPGHLKTEADFKKHYVKRGNPRDPLNRQRLRTLLGEVMIRNTRSLVQLNLPPRYAQTVIAHPEGVEADLYRRLTAYLRRRGSGLVKDAPADDADPGQVEIDAAEEASPSDTSPKVSRLQLSSLLSAQGSNPVAVAASLEKIGLFDPEAAALAREAATIGESAKDRRLLELLKQSEGHKLLIFVNFRRTLAHVADLLAARGQEFSVFSGEQTAHEKDEAVALFREVVPIMLCTESGGEGRNLQFADTLINYDLPWNPMRIEQRVGRIHRYGQTRDVFVFNLCTDGSLEARILNVLNQKIRMFELVVGEVGSILGNLEEGDQFESLVLDLWLKSRDETELSRSFEDLGDTLLEAQETYVQAKELDEALFGEDFQ